MVVGNLLSSVAGAFVGSAIFAAFHDHGPPVAEASEDDGPADTSTQHSAAEPSDTHAATDSAGSKDAGSDYLANYHSTAEYRAAYTDGGGYGAGVGYEGCGHSGGDFGADFGDF